MENLTDSVGQGNQKPGDRMNTEQQPTPILAEAPKIQELFPQDSKWDVTLKGRTIKLKIDPCNCGVKASWVYEVPIQVMLPPELKSIVGDRLKGESVQKVFAEWHFHPKWWERYILMHKLKPQLKKFIKEVHKDLMEIKNSEDSMDDLKKFTEEI